MYNFVSNKLKYNKCNIYFCRFVALNGKQLKLEGDTKLPSISPKVLPPGTTITLPSKTYVFLVFPDIDEPLCQ